MTRIFVSGADGFIGSYLVEALVLEGQQVCAFVQYNSFNSWGWLDDVSADVMDKLKLLQGILETKNMCNGLFEIRM